MNYREFVIRKKNGKVRNICAPDKALVKYQRKQLSRLLKVFLKMVKDTPIEDTHHGFIKNRNVITAAQKHIGFKSTIMLDISTFFDSVTYDMLPDNLQDSAFFHKTGGYTAQGFATSPMLANIASIPMVIDIDTYLRKITFGEYALSIYADDIQASFQTENYDFLNTVINTIGVIVKNHKFDINEDKTRIKYARYGYRRILGVNVGCTNIRATRKVMKKIRAAKNQKQKSSLGGLRNWAKCSLPKEKR